MRDYIVAFDQGTTSSRAVLIDKAGTVRDISQAPFHQYFPQPGWVEHDAQEILATQLSVFTDLLVRNGLQPSDIDSIGITNQRETTVVWDRNTGQPLCHAIVWQCRRTAPIVERICADPIVRTRIKETTGLVPDAYFSAARSSGCWTTCPARGSGPRRARSCSAPWTPGWCGSSPAAKPM